MSSALALRKRAANGCSARTRTILKSLGIPFRPGWGFWETNADQLEYIYFDFLKAARDRKRELHPDLNGDEKAFQEFSAICDMVKRQFRNRLPLTAAAIQMRAAEFEFKKEDERERKLGRIIEALNRERV
jgi:hypothetical protein